MAMPSMLAHITRLPWQHGKCNSKGKEKGNLFSKGDLTPTGEKRWAERHTRKYIMWSVNAVNAAL
jgi:hypothetical protein